jgi:hypothetical protein
MVAGPRYTYSLVTDRTENTASNSYSIVCYTGITEQWLFLRLPGSCFEQIWRSILKVLEIIP